MLRHLLPILLILLLNLSVSAQGNEIDSLQAHVRTLPEDTLKVTKMLELSSVYFSSAPEKAIIVAENAKKLAHKIGYRKGTAYALKNVGIAYYYQGEYVDALSSWQKSLSVFDSINDRIGVANIQSNIGAIYYNEGEYNRALDYYLKSLKVSEELKDTLRIVTALTNIGAVYIDKSATLDKALEYLSRALELSEKIGASDAIANSSLNIGIVYFTRKNYDLALEYYTRSLNAMQGTDGTVFTMIEIGKVYTKQGEYSKALKTLDEALETADLLNAKPNKTTALVAKAEVYFDLKDYRKAINLYREAIILAKETNYLKFLELSYLGLGQAYFASNRYDSAYKYQTLMVNVKDSLYNIETQKLLSNQLFNFQIEKKQNEINLLKKDQELQSLDLEKQKVVRNLVIAGFVSVIIFLLVAILQKRKISKEKDRSEKLLLNILPYEIAEELKEQGKSDARDFNQVSVLFTDFVAFTELSEKLTAKELVNEINYYFKAFDNVVSKYRIEKIKTIGDAYMAAGGVPVPNPNSVKNVVLAALEMQNIVKEKREQYSDTHILNLFSMRIGIHTGPVVAGIVGVKKFQYDIWGDTVNTAARMESSCEVGKVNISEVTYEIIKDSPELEFEHRGKIEAKGKGKLDMYFVRKKSIIN
ncbi:adenylate/guanylate cyclase domain-containing protein [Owenweeksia hongkongensis]|uniref:adenylate/guanylate cyclase domain-containing protein n=1 Tax=Owenweeksia hongkongensis TaxID=253245 RepID=UPI003A9435AF